MKERLYQILQFNDDLAFSILELSDKFLGHFWLFRVFKLIRALNSLERKGLIESKHIGMRKYYRLKKEVIMPAKVIEIQVGGSHTCHGLKDTCEEYLDMLKGKGGYAKIHFFIELPNGEHKSITIRDEDEGTVAYGDFEGLPSFLDYAREET